MSESIRVWLNNAKSFHHRIMMRYLRKRGWVVFYLEKDARKCNDMCWLDLHEGEMSRMSDKTIQSNGGSAIVGGSTIGGGGSAIGGGTCPICNKPVYVAGWPTNITFDICKGHPNENETLRNELEAAKAKIKELQALIQAGDYGQRKKSEDMDIIGVAGLAGFVGVSAVFLIWFMMEVR